MLSDAASETGADGSMLLEGSCHCGAVRFRVESREPAPFMYCYCSICRKTAGGGGFAINLGADADSLETEGEEHISVYHARMDRGGEEIDLPPIPPTSIATMVVV